jgi:hypothetical protein
MPIEPTLHTVCKSINKPLTIGGAERSLFFMALLWMERRSISSAASSEA